MDFVPCPIDTCIIHLISEQLNDGLSSRTIRSFNLNRNVLWKAYARISYKFFG